MSYVRKEEVQAILDEALAENVTIFWHSVIKKRLDRLQTYREQKVGKWIRGGHCCGETDWKCSVCGADEWRTNATPFCMWCGAKMEGAEE